MNDSIDLNLNTIPSEVRHPRVFEAFDSLPVGGGISLHVDHDPKLLRRQFEALRQGTFSWSLGEGDGGQFKVLIRKLGESTDARAPHHAAGCCGVCGGGG